MAAKHAEAKLVTLLALLLALLQKCKEEKEKAERAARQGVPLEPNFIGLVGLMWLLSSHIVTEGQNRGNRRTEQGRDIAEFTDDQSIFGDG